MSTIVINIGRQSDGCTYQLNPRSRVEIQTRFPGVRSVPTIFMGYKTESDFEQIHGPVWKQIAMLLTGLSWRQIEEMGGLSIYDPVARETRKVA